MKYKKRKKPRAGFSGASYVALACRPRQPGPNQLRAIPLSHQGTVAIRASPKYHPRHIKVSTDQAAEREKVQDYLNI